MTTMDEIRDRHPASGHVCPWCDEYNCADGQWAPSRGTCDTAMVLARVAQLETVVAAAKEMNEVFAPEFDNEERAKEKFEAALAALDTNAHTGEAATGRRIGPEHYHSFPAFPEHVCYCADPPGRAALKGKG